MGQDPAEQDGAHEFGGYQSGRGLVRGAADSDDEEAEATCGQRGVEKIEPVRRARRARQRLQADPYREHAEREVDREQPWPWPQRQDAGGDRRPEGEGGADHQRVIAEAATEHAGRVDEADQRRVHAHDAAGAQPLQRACRRQAGQRPCEGAAERGQGEQQQAAEIDPLMADDFAERAEWQQRRNQRDLIDVDHPDHVGRADMEVGGNRRQRDVGDRRIERGQR